MGMKTKIGAVVLATALMGLVIGARNSFAIGELDLTEDNWWGNAPFEEAPVVTLREVAAAQ